MIFLTQYREVYGLTTGFYPLFRFIFCPFSQKGQTAPISGCGKFSPGNSKGVQIGTGEHGVQTVLVLLQSPIHRFLVAELALDDSECVLHFAPNRGFAIFNVSFPVDGVVRYMRQFARTAVDAKINLCEVLVFCDLRRSFTGKATAEQLR